MKIFAFILAFAALTVTAHADTAKSVTAAGAKADVAAAAQSSPLVVALGNRKPDCMSNTQCAANSQCVGGACAEIGTPGADCRTGGGCATGYTCSSKGLCK